MDPKTSELLMKARKGADAGFGVKQWTQVLEAIGFRVQTQKAGNSVIALRVTVPNASTLVITKKPGYRCIVFYDLRAWAKKEGADIPELASKVLGLPSLEEEKKLKDLYVRDLTNTGTCGVCDGNFKREANGSLHHHGFQRPGDGYLHGSCFGVGYQPFELTVAAARDYLFRILRPGLAIAQENLEELLAGKVTSFTKKVRDYTDHKEKSVTYTKGVEADRYEYERMLESAIHATERQVKWMQRDIKVFELKEANWKEDVLPEVKYAGLFKKAS